MRFKYKSHKPKYPKYKSFDDIWTTTSWDFLELLRIVHDEVERGARKECGEEVYYDAV